MNLFHANQSIFLSPSINLSSVTSSLYKSFHSSTVDHKFKRKIQKFLASDIKPHLFPDTTLNNLSYKASLQRIIISPAQIRTILNRLSNTHFLLSATFIKVSH